MARIFKFLRIGSAALLGGLITSGLGYILITGYFGFGEKLVNRSYNLTVTLPRFFESPTLADEVMIVYMDDESYAQLRQNENLAFNRSIHAALLERLSMDGAKAAVFDVIFDNETPSADIHPVPPGLGFEDADQYFASVMTNRFPNVVLGADQVEIGKTREGAGGVEYVTPIEALDLACGDIGNVYLEADSDLIVRRHKRYLEEDFVHTLSVAAAQMIDAPVVKNAELMNEEKWINYYGPPVTLPAVSYYQAVDFSICKPGFFKNKVVFIGARILTTKATERKDAYPSPFSYWMQNRSRSYSIGEDGEWVLTKKADLFMPGVEIQATMFLNLIRQDWLRRIDKDDEGQAIILLGLLFGIALTQVRPLVASMLAAVSFVGLLGFSYFLLKETNSWFAWTIVALEIGFAYVWSIVFNSVSLYVDKRLMQQSLGAYVSPAMVKAQLKSGEMMRPGASKRYCSILFSDVANFTAMSEGMDPDELARVMNNYFEVAVTSCIQKTDGTVVKFIGDAIFAIWNAPEPQENHEFLACRGALNLRDGVARAFEDVECDKEIRTRIGLHSGEANVGNFGSRSRFDYTAFGENINLAARMEGLNKYVGTDILITGEVEQAVPGKFVTRFVGYFVLKGFAKAFKVFELVDELEKADNSKVWRDLFETGLNHYFHQEFDEAEQTFLELLALKPGDGPSNFYLQQIAEARSQNLPEDWQGEILMADK